MLTYSNVVGNQEDWANYITNVDNRDTPFVNWLPVGSKPVNVLYQYQADKFADPRVNAHVDGQPWTNFNSAADNRGAMKALIQWFDNTTSVSKLSEDVSNAAGVADELARDIPKRLKEMGRDMEVAFLGDQDHREGTTTAGYHTRGVGSWTSTSAQTLYPVPESFRPPSGSVDTTTTSANMTEDVVRNLIESVATETGNQETLTAWVGPKIKRMFTNFTFCLPSAAAASYATQASGSTFNQDGTSGKIVRNVTSYEGDFGMLDLRLNWWLARVNSSYAITNTPAATQQYRMYLLHRERWEMRWNQKPTVYKPEFKGGSYEAAMDAICMLVCRNPRAEGKYAPTS